MLLRACAALFLVAVVPLNAVADIVFGCENCSQDIVGCVTRVTEDAIYVRRKCRGTEVRVPWKAGAGFDRSRSAPSEESGFTQPGCRQRPNIISIDLKNSDRTIYAKRVSIKKEIVQVHPYNSNKVHSVPMARIVAMQWWRSFCLR
jgi:hypothetical protein